jgi:DMSO reductase anchor subunit
MKKALEFRLHSFHEAPLVVFSAAALSGAGVAIAWPLASVMGFCPSPPDPGAATLILILLGGGILASMMHLGRPARAALALRRAGRSPLSTEVVFAGLTASAALSLRVLPLGASSVRALWFLAGAAGAGFLISLIRVYWLPGQPTWRGIPGLSPIPLSLLFGFTTHFLAAGLPPAAAIPGLAILLFADTAVWVIRCVRVEQGRKTGMAAQPFVMARRGWVMSVRFALTTLLYPAALLYCGGAWGLAVLGAGILADRFAFYALAVRHGSEAEVARIEAILVSISHS